MSIQLYREGNKHQINGIWCEAGSFTKQTAALALESGDWFKSPDEVKFVDDDMPDELDTMSNDKIRALAKERGLEGWDKRRIAPLKEALREHNKED